MVSLSYVISGFAKLAAPVSVIKMVSDQFAPRTTLGGTGWVGKGVVRTAANIVSRRAGIAVGEMTDGIVRADVILVTAKRVGTGRAATGMESVFEMRNPLMPGVACWCWCRFSCARRQDGSVVS